MRRNALSVKKCFLLCIRSIIILRILSLSFIIQHPSHTSAFFCPLFLISQHFILTPSSSVSSVSSLHPLITTSYHTILSSSLHHIIISLHHIITPSPPTVCVCGDGGEGVCAHSAAEEGLAELSCITTRWDDRGRENGQQSKRGLKKVRIKGCFDKKIFRGTVHFHSSTSILSGLPLNLFRVLYLCIYFHIHSNK